MFSETLTSIINIWRMCTYILTMCNWKKKKRLKKEITTSRWFIKVFSHDSTRRAANQCDNSGQQGTVCHGKKEEKSRIMFFFFLLRSQHINGK